MSGADGKPGKRSGWAPFVYREFDDVPRSVLVTLDGEALFLTCEFDPRTEAWESTFSVFTRSPAPDLASWWWRADETWLLLGRVPVAAVEFDPTRRTSVKLDSLNVFRP